MIRPVEAADVLIVTAVAEEHAAVLAVETGAAPGSAWAEHEGVAFRDFDGEGGTLRVAVVQALGMGGTQAAIASSRPEAFLPDLAVSLHNVGLRQSELGRHEAALTLAEEALDAI